MGIRQGVTSQVGQIAKGAVKQIVQEPTEVLKSAAEQTVGAKIPQVEQMPQTRLQQKVEQPSLEQQRRDRRLMGYRNELEELIRQERQRRKQKIQETKMVEEKKEEEKQQEKVLEKESRFQKTLKFVTGRAKRRVEMRLPKAA